MQAFLDLASILPNPAGLILAAGVAALGCALYVVVETGIRRESVDWATASGGVFAAIVFGVVGAAMAALGAPTFD